MLVGYVRVSTKDQNLEIQEAALREAGCEKIFAEKKSGHNTNDRPMLRDAVEWTREGDTLMVTRLDRLARSVGDLFVIIEKLHTKGVAFRCLQQSEVNTDSSSGRLMLAVLGAVAAFESDLRRERQAEGIAKAKMAGVYKGRKPSIDSEEVRKLHERGFSPSEIARRLEIGRSSVYRHLSG